MTVQDFLNTYQNAMLSKKNLNPLNRNTKQLPTASMGVTPGNPSTPQSPSWGNRVPSWLQDRSSSAVDGYMQKKTESTSALASKYADMAGGQVATDEWGIPTDKLTNISDYFNKNLQAIDDTGKAALATDEAKAQWQSLQNQAEQNAGYTFTMTPGASSGNKGAQAVSIAMNAVKNGTPYVWGGNSLTQGVDCSGLVQQVYKQMGITLPRTTYEQAKSGKMVSMGSLLPGDLIFYNTGGNDPNGIGSLSHVAIYIGNGQVIDAPGKGRSVRVTSLNNSGSPARAVRPW